MAGHPVRERPVLCAACHAKNRADWRRCQRCGADLTARVAAFTAGAGRAARSAGPAWPVFGALALATLVVALVVWPRAPQSAPSKAAGLVEPAAPPAPVARATPAPVDPRDAAREGVAAYAQGDPSGAAARFEEAAAGDPNDAASLNDLGQMLVRGGRVREALAPLRHAVELAPGSWAYRFNLARARGLSGDWPGAVEDYRRADALFPDDYPTLYNLALALQKAERPDEALPVLERVAQLQPAEPSFQLTLAMAYEAASRQDAAVAAYTRFLDLSPGASEAPAVRAHLARLQPPGSLPEAMPGDGTGPVRSLSAPVGHGPA